MEPTWGSDAEQHRGNVAPLLVGGLPGAHPGDAVGEVVLGLAKEPRPEGAGASWKARQHRS